MAKAKIEKLREFCQLIADVGVANAVRLRGRFEQTLRRFGYAEIMGTESHAKSSVLHYFICMNFALANGVWSNLQNSSLRKDLMAESLRTFTLKSVPFWTQSPDTDDRAYAAVGIQEELERFWKACLERMKEMDAAGIEVDANAVVLRTLELIQSHLKLSDEMMNRIVPAFVDDSPDFAEVERVANQLNSAAEARKKMSLWDRFIEGWRRGDR